MSSLLGRKDLLDRIHSRTEVTSEGCRILVGGLSTNGYANISVDGSKMLLHRVAYEVKVGPIPEGLDLDHLCRNRACCETSHLEPVTRKENVRRGVGHGSEVECAKGHPYSLENTYRYPESSRQSGQRVCKICRNRRTKEAKRKARGIS